MVVPNSSLPWILFLVVCISVQASSPLQRGVVNDDLHVDDQSEGVISPEISEHSDVSLNETQTMVENVVNNDTRTCFPYFISQDIESLLNQALRMLAKARNDRRRSWLQLFVHRLESLSSQLRQLPVEHKSRCFHIRERLDFNGVNPNNLASAPEEIQLRFAKRLFVASQYHRANVDHNNHNNDGLKEYVMGTISNGRNINPAGLEFDQSNTNYNQPSQSNKSAIAHLSNKNIEKDHEISAVSGQLDIDPNIISSTESQHKSDSNRESAKALSITNWERQNQGFENMPFLPRATRKQMLVPVREGIMPRFLSSRTKDLGTTATEPGKNEAQTTQAIVQSEQSQNGATAVHKEPTTADSQASVANNQENHRGPSTQQYEESVAQLHDHELLSASPASTERDSDINTPKVTEELDNDDLVIQLHSGGNNISPNQRMHPRLLINRSPMNSKMSYATPSGPPSESSKIDQLQELDVPEKMSEKAALDPRIPIYHGKVDEARITPERMSEKAALDPRIPIHKEVYGTSAVDNGNHANNMDFDYEEQGAAAGELFIDDDIIPTKYLTAPTSVASTDSYEGNADEVVRQLDELKSLKTDSLPSHSPTHLAEARPGAPLTRDDIYFKNDQRSVVDDK